MIILVKYWLPITANFLSMHFYILEGHNFHILISTNDLSIITNALYLLPMFCQCKVLSICFYEFVPIMIGKNFVKNIMVHW